MLTVGDKVIYSKYAGTEVELDDEEYIIVRQNDILAVDADNPAGDHIQIKIRLFRSEQNFILKNQE